MSDIAAEEDLLFALAKGHGSELFAPAPLADHCARELSGLFDIIACAGGHMAENQFFRGPTTKHHGQSSHQVVTRICIAVIERELLSHSQRHSSGNDRDFVDRI